MKLLQEPLLHFLVAGAVLFGAYAWIDDSEESSDAGGVRQVQIGEGEVQWLKQTWALQWQREPTPEELRTLVAELLKEQLLAREAREMKLDENDTVVRRRLAQKLTFLIEDTLRRAEPNEDDLRRFYEARRERFRSDARVSFTHVYFNPARRQDAVADAMNALTELIEAGGTDRARSMGDRLLLEPVFHGETEQTLSSVLGRDFAAAVFRLEPGAWSGPIRSGYGLHLVRVSARKESVVRPFAEVRAQVLEEWRREQERAANAQYLAQLRRKYDVVIEESVKPLLGPL
jgi:parvulin-like peptidyl-prolyl isomerase